MLRVELSEERVLRRAFAVPRRVVVRVRRSRMEVSRMASCSVVHASAAFCMGLSSVLLEMVVMERGYLEGMIDNLFACEVLVTVNQGR